MANTDYRKEKVKSLTNKSKQNPYRACETCKHFNRTPLKQWDGYCLRYKFRVNMDELCGAYSYFQLSAPLDELSNDDIDLVKGYSRARKGQGEDTVGIRWEENYSPSVTPNDYKKGFIIRKFIQNKSDIKNPFREVQTYDNYPGKYFHHIDLSWKISGPVYKDKQNKNGLILEKSCYTYNQDSVSYVGITHPTFRNRITNYIFLAEKKKK